MFGLFELHKVFFVVGLAGVTLIIWIIKKQFTLPDSDGNNAFMNRLGNVLNILQAAPHHSKFSTVKALGTEFISSSHSKDGAYLQKLRASVSVDAKPQTETLGSKPYPEALSSTLYAETLSSKPFHVEEKDSLDKHLDMLTKSLAEKEGHLRISKTKFREKKKEIENLNPIEEALKAKYDGIMESLRRDLATNEKECKKLQERIEWVSQQRAELNVEEDNDYPSYKRSGSYYEPSMGQDYDKP